MVESKSKKVIPGDDMKVVGKKKSKNELDGNEKIITNMVESKSKKVIPGDDMKVVGKKKSKNQVDQNEKKKSLYTDTVLNKKDKNTRIGVESKDKKIINDNKLVGKKKSKNEVDGNEEIIANLVESKGK